MQRVGLRPVMIDLSTAIAVNEGTSWWRELFFCGRVLQLRDDEGNRLYLEAWLWDGAVREWFVEGCSAGVSR